MRSISATFSAAARNSAATTPDASARAGLVFALGAYLAWGFVPAYFKMLTHVPPFVVLCHRVVWSVAFLAILLAVQSRGREVAAVVRDRRMVLTLTVSTLLIAVNWYVFIWAVTNGRVLQASLGYYINPLVNVLLGVVILRERLRIGQIAGLALAASGVAVLTASHGSLPWVSLALALSFGMYGLLRKLAPVGPVVGLSVETGLLLPVAVTYIAVTWPSGGVTSEGLAGISWGTYGLLALAGVITAIPLIWFAAAARRLRLTTIGFLQYLAPTCQFLLAVFAYGEAFTRTHGWAFGLIWAALVVYTVDSVRALRRKAQPRPEEPLCCEAEAVVASQLAEGEETAKEQRDAMLESTDDSRQAASGVRTAS